MTLGGGLVLGIVQGLTEFLPVSSTGHLIIAREFFGLSGDGGLAFDAVLQLGTILAVAIYFRRDLAKLVHTFWHVLNRRPTEAADRTLLLAIVFGTLPALVFGLAFESYMETSFRSLEVVAVTLILGSLLFEISERRATQNSELNLKRGFLVGCFQTLALIPGMSRSGATISGGLFLGLTREAAARFSFLLSFPLILGTGLKKFIDLLQADALAIVGPELALGFFSAFAVGYLCIAFLLRFLKTNSLRVFIVYRLTLAALIIGFLAVRN